MAAHQPIKLVTKKIADVLAKDDEKMAFFAKHWDGNLHATLEIIAGTGVQISRAQASRFMRHPGFIRMLRQTQGDQSEGVWTRVELQQWLTRVVAGFEVTGYETIYVPERVLPGESDFDESLGSAPQWRQVECKVPRYPEVNERLKAADLLGKTLGAYLDRVEVTGDMKIAVTDLLDDDLKHAKPVIEASTQVVDELTQVIDNSPKQEVRVDDLLS